MRVRGRKVTQRERKASSARPPGCWCQRPGRCGMMPSVAPFVSRVLSPQEDKTSMPCYALSTSGWLPGGSGVHASGTLAAGRQWS